MSRRWFIVILLQAWALAAVRVSPGPVTVAAGSTCAFTATRDGEQPAGGWRWSILAGPGDMDEDTGLYRAPGPGSAAAVQVRAALRSDPRVTGRADIVVLPLPESLPGLISATLGEPWLEPLDASLPFLDPETGRRPVPEAQIIHGDHPAKSELKWCCPVGYGIPIDFWAGPTEQLDALRLTYREGNQWIRKDLDGAGRGKLVWRGRVTACRLEALKRSAQQPGKWRSSTTPMPVEVRGVLPYCGNAVAPGGHEDGPGLAARFQRPFGLVHLNWNGDADQPLLLVSDPGSHVLRTVTRDGEAATLCGQPGQAGHRDSPSLLERMATLVTGQALQPPLFHSPTHVAMRRRVSGINPFSVPWEEALVADSGNHVIRTVRADGEVATLAGTPGRPGYRDSESLSQAAFNDPQGLAVDEAGRVYVADRGNRAIRVIRPGGVTTLVGPQGGFTDLRGMCHHPALGGLLVLDGHALRLVRLPGGEVSTLLGVVDTPGFREIRPDENREQPCLNDPTGITCCGSGLAIADHGNHAVRILNADCSRMWTAAGDPGQGATRWGLIRDHLPGPLDEGYGTLEGPWTVACRCHRQGWSDTEVFVTAGRCLAEISHEPAGRWRLALRAEVPPPEAVVDETCVVVFAVNSYCPVVYCTADFLDPDGECRARVQGVAAGGERVSVQGRFTQAGAGTVRIRGVTDEGMSAATELKVQIR